jgi:hypothetical protein
MLEEKDGTPICRLNANSGIYLIKWDEMIDTERHTANHVSLSSPISHLSLTSASYYHASHDHVSPLTD